MNPGEALIVYLTAPDQAVAERLADVLVGDRAAACVNILGAIQSVYRWEGKIERGQEIALIVKTTAERYPVLETLVKRHHPYTCPCIIAWPASHSAPEYLAWIMNSV